MYTAVIRQRGQFTIPDKLRSIFEWLAEGAVVGLEVGDESVVLKPHFALKKQQFDWDEMWRKINLARSFRGARGSLSELIEEDRLSH